MKVYAHCDHCAWGHKHHPDQAPHHDTPCVLGCPSHEPAPATEPALFPIDQNGDLITT